MMVNRAIISILFFLASVGLNAQEFSFVGMAKSDVENTIRKSHRNFSEDQSVIKKQFNYLKYINGSQTITWIFYFTDQDICRATKKVCDYSEYDFVLDDLEENFEPSGDMQWEYTVDGQTYTISLEEQDWYFTLREEKKEE